MRTPRRVQLSRARGWRKPPGTVVVARPSRWGNPFRVGETYMWPAGEDGTGWPLPTHREPGDHEDGVRVVRCPDRATAVEWYRRWADSAHAEQARQLLAGRDLACWCPVDEPCHADVLLELANRTPALR
ncbi:protein of unknown function [Geodermatophilus amargosae]|uniref:DUF4326 domain-containing protein n=1 Tax=Geodermatophilus amargosae TaxID=1296565 RepID=A0A1I6YRC4_9ACTN|nr:DUF4326 domain-containing protein [Geodermatophilus amargosae]SFT52996.1 protein of unknown function [Geodermatophilus amargosae]